VADYSQAVGTGFAAITRIDPKANEPRAAVEINPRDTFRGGGEPVLAAGAGALWLSLGDGHAYRLDPRKPAAATRLRGVDALEIAVGADAVWVVEPDDQAVTRVDPASNTVRATIPVGVREPSGLAVGAGSVWATDLAEDTVWRIDAVRNSVVGTIALGDGPTAVAATDDGVWVANRFSRSVSRIDPKTNTVVATIQLGREPRGIAVGNDSIWVTVA
jgi:virginiamycin B lyase